MSVDDMDHLFALPYNAKVPSAAQYPSMYELCSLLSNKFNPYNKSMDCNLADKRKARRYPLRAFLLVAIHGAHAI